MNQLEKMNQLYSQIKEFVQKQYSESDEAKEFIESDFTDKLAQKLELSFPFQYSSTEEGIYIFDTIEAFKEYLIERLSNEGVIDSSDYYESSEDEWQSSSC